MKFDRAFLDDLRDRIKISDVIGTRVTWDRKKTNASRGDYWACCPVHGEKRPSFHCEDRKGWFHCFGCGISGGHFDFFKIVDGMSFVRAVEEVAALAGMPLPSSKPLSDEEKAAYARRQDEIRQAQAKREQEAERDRRRRTETAGGIWKSTVPLAGTLGQVYFEWRSLPLPAEEDLRFHPGLPYPKQFADMPGLHPCVVARVQGPDGKGVGVWRIYLQPDGCGKLKGPPGDQDFKAKLGVGPTAGGAVRLGGLAKHIGLAEGVETARAVKALGQTIPIWSGLSTSGIIGFIIPEGVETVTVFADRDASKIRTREDGKVKRSPGIEAYRKFVENNPGRDIRLAAGPEREDYLEMFQRLKGLPQR